MCMERGWVWIWGIKDKKVGYGESNRMDWGVLRVFGSLIYNLFV